ncbi:hypothetical protein F4703DRAFT_1827872 [Phycomyces blakesleeanus]
MSTMLDEDDVLRSGFLDPGTSRYLLSTPSSLSRSMSSPIYTSHFGEDPDPWKSSNAFDPVADMRQGLGTHDAVADNILGSEVTAASVLVGIELPEIYDTAYLRAGPVDDRVSLEALGKVVSLATLPSRATEKVLHTAVPAGALYVTHNEFNTALALVACAQKNMEISLQTVYQHRNDLPIPTLPKLNEFHIKRNSRQILPPPANQTQQMDDPWKVILTPPNHNGPNSTGPLSQHNNNNHNHNDMSLNENTSLNNSHGRTQSMSSLNPAAHQDSHLSRDLKGNSFVPTHDIKPIAETLEWFKDLDVIKLSIAPEKEGFLFKHVNYVVESQKRQSIVLRRYSDFYWLWETLLKRYPFRLIPNLPPKKLGAQDDVFIEARKKGLNRFIHAIVRHPILKKDEVVDRFLTEPSELLAWRKANPPVTDEEFVRIHPETNSLEAYIPRDLEDRLEKLEKQLPKMVEHYHNMCAMMEKMIKLQEVYGTEMVRYSIALNKISETENTCFVPDCHGCKQVVRGYESVAKHMQKAGSITEEQVSCSIDSVLEDLKQYRDTLVSFKETMDRKPKLSVNQIDTLAKRLSANHAKVNQNRGVPGLESEVERLDLAIKTDHEKMTWQQQRDIHIRYSISCELSYIHKQHALVAHLYQNYTHDQLRFSRKSVDNWKALEVLTSDIPEPEEFA